MTAKPAHYITTPIYYPNAVPHLGHAYATIMADTIHRYKQLFGSDSFFLTGTDEHGQKVAEAAKERGLEPQIHVDQMSKQFEETWSKISITPSVFMRTTFSYHVKAVQSALQELFDKGLIYRRDYEGWYSVSEEIFYTDKDVKDGKSPEGKPVTKVKESNYFFKMSAYQDQLVQYINSHPDFILPAGKCAEVLGFLKQPLEDLCISRPKSRFTWGIELPFDKEYVCYVWFDALLNYTSAIGYRVAEDDGEGVRKYWPHVTHLIGKDILITHTVYWTTMLMALGLSLPKHIFAHGWWLNQDGRKMSKSEGDTLSPLNLLEVYGADRLRYLLVRMMRFGQDASFNPQVARDLLNEELANTYGNLLSRATTLVVQYFAGAIPAQTSEAEETVAIVKRGTELTERVKARIEQFEPDLAVQDIYSFLAEVNRYITVMEPWKAAKTGEAGLRRAGESLAATLEALRVCSVLLSPVMPTKSFEVLQILGNNRSPYWEALSSTTIVQKAPPLFPKIVFPELDVGS